MADDSEKSLILAIVQHLESASGNKEHLTQARTHLAAAYDLDLSDKMLNDKYGTGTHKLADVYAAGRAALAAAASANGGDASASASALADEDEAFQKFLNRLKGTAFFAGVQEGSDEYSRRVAKARAKFDGRKQDAPRSAPAAPVAAAAAADAKPMSTVSAETKAEADALKLEGNAQLKAGDFSGAVDTYSKCIALDGANAIYYGNRAAAKMHLKELASAVDDCKMAINIDPSYARAHERLANAYRSLGMHDAELDALENATRQHADNAQLARMLADAQARGKPAAGAGAGAVDAQQLADMAASMGMPNVSPDMVRGFMDSPLGAQLAGAMAGGNPAMAQMLDAVKDNPEIMQKAMEAMQKDPDMMSKMLDALK